MEFISGSKIVLAVYSFPAEWLQITSRSCEVAEFCHPMIPPAHSTSRELPPSSDCHMPGNLPGSTQAPSHQQKLFLAGGLQDRLPYKQNGPSAAPVSCHPSCVDSSCASHPRIQPHQHHISFICNRLDWKFNWSLISIFFFNVILLLNFPQLLLLLGGFLNSFSNYLLGFFTLTPSGDCCTEKDLQLWSYSGCWEGDVYQSFKIQIIFMETTENYLWSLRSRQNPDFRLLL